MFIVDADNCVRRGTTNGALVKCFLSLEEAQAYIDSHLYSPVAEFSMNIVKASYDKADNNPRRWRAVDSDIDSDLYDEKMSIELFKDFTDRIENNTPVPEEFKSVICEDSWCGGMPYLSIAHYKAGEQAKNVSGKVEAIYIDGTRLKSKGILDDTPMGRKVFDALCDDLYRKKSGDIEHLPVRISIGFLDLVHKHVAEHGGQDFTFTRKSIGQICPLCQQGIGGKIYMKGQLVHLALTRVPVNPRTEMVAEKSMEAIITKKDDAKSIIKELADELDERSLADGTLVVRATGESNVPDARFAGCYDSNTDTYNQDCLNKVLVANMVDMRKQMTPVKSDTDVAEISKSKSPSATAGVMEASMETVEKMVLGGESVPEKKFEYAGIDGDPGNNVTAAPIPVKAKVEIEKEDDEDDKEDGEDDKEEKVKKSALDSEYAQLKSLLEGGATTEEINAKFASFASVAEKSYAPKPESVDMQNLAEIIRSAVASAVQPLQIEIAQLKAGVAVNKSASSATPVSRGLTFKPEDFLLKSQTNQAPKRKLSQIEMIARRSTGASVE